MDGKSKCKILKDIRAKIAQENDIEYVTSECKFQGNCSGACPKCEAELRYLEEELQKRRAIGKKVAVAGVAAALVVGASGCDLFDGLEIGGKAYVGTTEETTEKTTEETTEDTTKDKKYWGVTFGDVPYEETTELRTMGDVAWP